MLPTRNFQNQWVNNDYYEEQHHEDYDEEEEKFTHEDMYLTYYNPSQIQPDLADEDIFQEKIIQDKRSMQNMIEYKDFVRPEFYQGPQFVVYRQLTTQNRKKRIYSSELEDIHFQQRNMDKHDLAYNQLKENGHKRVIHVESKKEKYTYRKEVYGQEFDFKMEKRVENQFWATGDSHAPKKSVKQDLHQAPKSKLRSKVKKVTTVKETHIKHDSHKRGGDKHVIKSRSHHEDYKGRQERGPRQKYEEYLPEDQIKKGLEAGTLF